MHYYGERQGWKLAVAILLCLPFVFWGGLRAYKSIIFKINCTGHIKRAADANTIELATREMETVVSYMEKEGLTNGFTSILYRTPDEDVEFWYKNLQASLDELKKIRPDSAQLEKSNILMKLRETLLDSGREGVEITHPAGISIYPQNVSYLVLLILSLLSMTTGGILFKSYFDL